VRRVSAIALFTAFVAASTAGFAEPPNPALPTDFVSLTVCSVGTWTGEACATLNRASILKVEEHLGQQVKVIYRDRLAPDLSRHLVERVQSLIRSFPGAKRDTYVLDGNGLTVSLCFKGDKVDVRIDGIARASDAGPDADALIKLLHDIVPDESRFR
jgi:hypothetical protein